MVISDKNKYLFVELPRTASTAISKELCENYDGIQILYKHATYDDFLKTASYVQQKYFTFSCIRNPLDKTLSQYFRLKNDHKGYFSKLRKKNNLTLAEWYLLRKYDFVQNKNADFVTYIKKISKFPYNDWSCLSHKQFDYVIKFENIQNDFAHVVKLLGLKQKRPLPVVNRTSLRNRDFLPYYKLDITELVKKKFSPFMRRWGYDLPSEWGNSRVSWINELEFQISTMFMKLYWKYFRSWENRKTPKL